jgi:RecA-family ATPase
MNSTAVQLNTPQGMRAALDRAEAEERKTLGLLKSEVTTCFSSLDLASLSAGRFLSTRPQPVEWILEDSLPLGRVGLLVADGGTGKGFFALQLGVSVATGVPFLDGLYEVGTRGKVLMVFGEDDEQTVHHRLYGIAQGLVDPSHRKAFDEAITRNLYVLSVCGQDARLTQAVGGNIQAVRAYDDLLTFAKGIEDLRLIVIDPISRFFAGDENSAQDGTYFFSLLENLSKETGATVLASHHTNKSSGAGKESIHQHAGRGTSAFADAVRWQMNFARVSGAEWQSLGIDPNEVHRYLVGRVVKKNMGPPEDFFHLKRGEHGVLRLAHLKPGRYAEGDAVLAAAIEQIRQDAEQRKRYTVVGFSRAFSNTWKGFGRRRLETILKEAIERGTLILEAGQGKTRDENQYLVVGETSQHPAAQKAGGTF